MDTMLTIKRLIARYPDIMRWDLFLAKWRYCLPLIKDALGAIDLSKKRVIIVSKNNYTSYSIIFAYLLKTQAKKSVYVETYQNEVDNLDQNGFASMEACDYNFLVFNSKQDVPRSNFYERAYIDTYNSWLTYCDNYEYNLILLCPDEKWLVRYLGLKLVDYTIIRIPSLITGLPNCEGQQTEKKGFRGDLL